MLNKSPSISGCEVKIVIDYATDRIEIMKSCDGDYANRLVRQTHKQIKMLELLPLFNIDVPKVTGHGTNWFTMEYLPYVNYIDFVQMFPVEVVKSLLQRVIDYMATTLDTCVDIPMHNTHTPVAFELFRHSFPKQYTYLGEMIEKLPISNLPVGVCHGDLTFSNMLFKNDSDLVLSTGRIAFIDFMDVSRESPVVDVIKLRQDAKYHWTSFMTLEPHDRIKVHIVDEWFLAQLDIVLINAGFKIADYKYWEAYNYLRIFKYTDEERVRDYLECVIMEIIK